MRLAGGPDESVCQPLFHPSGDIYFVSDRTDWWNLYRYHHGEVIPVAPMQAECAVPMWNFGMQTYAFVDEDTVVCLVNESGRMWLGLIYEGKVHEMETDYDWFAPTLAVHAGQVVVIAANAACAAGIVQLDLLTHEIRVLHSSTHLLIDAAYFSLPQPITFPTDDGAVAHAYYYAPQHPYYQPLAGEKPPLIVLSHGGPTASASTALNLKIQYWTTRGFAVVDVNYRGSVGFGRAYRQALNGQWGIVDVADCVQAARYLVEAGWVDPARLIIKGSSAGGFTTLCALTFYRAFAAGASYYGVADLASLVHDTHKFEAHYLEQLVGPYPRAKALYAERSPLQHAEHLTCPVIFFQGLEDKVVPPSQAEAMMAALENKQVPYAYVVFPHEQHGFRDARSITRALQAELSFYAQILQFPLPEPLEPVEIKHFHPSSGAPL